MAAVLIVALAALLATLALLTSSSGATVEGLHQRIGTLVPSGKCALGEAGAPAELGGVAVNEATHDIYVVDKGKHRLDKIGPNGECLATVGLPAPEQVAVDNTGTAPSGGAVYVTVATKVGEETHEGVRKLTDEGSSFKTVTTIAHYFDPELEGLERHKSFEEQGEEVLGVGVDVNGTVWIYATNAIYAFNNAEKNEFVSRTEVEDTCVAMPGFAVSQEGAPFFAGREFEKPNAECEPEHRVMTRLNGEGRPEFTESTILNPAYYAQLDTLPTTGVAVDRTNGDVYFDNGTSVEAFKANGSFLQRFGDEAIAGGSPLTEGAGIAVDSSTNHVIVADGATKSLDIFGPKQEEQGGSPNPEEPKELPHPDGRGYELVNPADKRGAAVKPIDKGGTGLLQAAESGGALTFASTAPLVPGAVSNRAPEPTSNLAVRTPTGWLTQSLALPRSPVPTGLQVGGGAEYQFFASDLSSAIIDQNPGTFEPHEPKLSPEATETTEYRRDLTRSDCTPLPSSCYEAIVGPNDTLSPTPAFGDHTQFVDATGDGRHVIVSSQVPLNAEGNPKEVEAAAQENGGEPGKGLAYMWSPGAVVPPRTEPTGTLELINEPPPGEALTKEQEKNGEFSAGQGVTSVIGENNPGKADRAAGMRGAISSDGTQVIWQNGGRRLYLRDLPRHESIRIDLPEAGVTPAEGEEPSAQFGVATPNMHDIFFTDAQHLSKESTGTEGLEAPEGQSDLYDCELVEGAGGKPKCNLTDLTTGVGSAGEAASVQGVVGASEDGSTVYFVANGVLAPHAGRGHCGLRETQQEEEEEVRGEIARQTCSLYVKKRVGGKWQAPKLVATLANTDNPDWRPFAPSAGITSRVSPNGQYVAFMSSQSLTGFDNRVLAEPQLAAEEVFIDNSEKEKGLTCVSCNAPKKEGGEEKAQRPHGVFDPGTGITEEGPGLVMDRPEIWRNRFIAGDIPGWTGQASLYGLYLSRALSDSGRLFFNATDALVPADKNQKTDVYEFEPEKVGSCASANGCINLVSSGKAAHESTFLDASLTGNDVFLYTDFPLTSQADTSANIYDAHVCTAESPCTTPPPPPVEEKCSSEGTCKTPSGEMPAAPPVGPSTQTTGGNKPHTEVLSLHEEKHGEEHHGKHRPTKKELLAKALKACHKKHNKHQRQACERAARKRYGKAASHRRGHR